jgi:hypothetical protein
MFGCESSRVQKFPKAPDKAEGPPTPMYGPLARHYVQPGTHCQISTTTRKGAESNLV